MAGVPIKLLATPEKKINTLKDGVGLFGKFMCLLDDIPILLLKTLERLGSFLLSGAGFIMFPLQAILAIMALKKTFDEEWRAKNHEKRNTVIKINAAKLTLSILGLVASGALLAFILTGFSVLAAAASIAIPAIMAIISGVELVGHVLALNRAKRSGQDQNTVIPKQKVIFSAFFLGCGVAITVLATLCILTSLGVAAVASFGIVPVALLIAVVVSALLVKIFQLVDKYADKLSKDKVEQYYFTESIRKGLGLTCASTKQMIKVMQDEPPASPEPAAPPAAVPAPSIAPQPSGNDLPTPPRNVAKLKVG